MVETLPISLQSIVEFFEKEKNLNPSNIERAVKSANVSVEDLEAWADYDHPKQDGYGRKMVYKGETFEIMVMSWNPGDFSAIHDHGYTQFGTVQLFGEADHAIFEIHEKEMRTISRWQTAFGDTIPVNHDLIHQMGNPGDIPYLTLHVYGTDEVKEFVTGEARIYDLERSKIQRSNGGAFFHLPSEEVVKEEVGVAGDFITQFRFLTEACHQLLKGGATKSEISGRLELLTSPVNKDKLLHYLNQIIDPESDKVVNNREWTTLQLELKAFARLVEHLENKNDKTDQFDEYAPLYDAIIGHNSLDFQKRYLEFFSEFAGMKLSDHHLLSVGCGTGLVEEWIKTRFDLPSDQLLGIDIAESMVKVANLRIEAQQQDFLNYMPDHLWDVVFTGLNVFQYLDARGFDRAIQKAAEITKPGGYFVGDFITPDHVRWYPNVMYSENKDVISCRTPNVLDAQPYPIQESEIINISFLTRSMFAYYAGKHQRILPSISEVASLFEQYFGGKSALFDAVTLKEMSASDQTCESTRYIVIIKKEKDR
jgi:cysteine dioxygenase